MRKFEKVSYAQFEKDFLKIFPYHSTSQIQDVYDNIKLPERKTKKSAGYDIHSTISMFLCEWEEMLLPTGIKASMDDDDVMMIFPRSSLGFKYYLRLANTTGVGDSDYYNNKDNEGHYFVKIRNEGDSGVNINRGDAIAQAVFIKYGVTEDDNVTNERVGGIGSTSKGNV